MDASDITAKKIRHHHWCDVCGLDLQSLAALTEHQQGRKHQKKMMLRYHQQQQGSPAPHKRPLFSESFLPMEAEELFDCLASGVYKNIVVLSGAGVSTAAGVPDLRSLGGLFSRLRERFSNRLPEVIENPEMLLSRSFVKKNPLVWTDEVWPLAKLDMNGILPTETHQFCAWLAQRNWLRRVYTQNVDGLHIHPTLITEVPSLFNKVVECHGSLDRGDLVFYEDDLPKAFYMACDEDFHENQNPVDLLLVFGTSLQVAPFCAVPNLVPKGCVRVLVNRYLDESIHNNFSKQRRGASMDGSGGLGNCTNVQIGRRKSVTLRPLWTSKEGRRRWRQLMVEGDCDDFCRRFFSTTGCQTRGYSLALFRQGQEDNHKTL